MTTSSGVCPICLASSPPRPEPDKTWFAGFRGEQQLVRCGDCSVVYLRGLQDQAVETRTEQYVASKIMEASREPPSAQNRLFERRLQQAARRVRGRRVLDVGCGNGAFLLAARTAGWQPMGVDNSDTACQLLAASGIEVALADSVEFLEQQPGRFDFIHMNHSLEHIARAAETVLAARNALVPGGLLYVEVPNELDNLVYRSLELLGRKRQAGSILGRSTPPREPSPHLYFFNKKSLGILARRAGFSSFQVHARRREPLEADPTELAGAVAAVLNAGFFLTLTATKT